MATISQRGPAFYLNWREGGRQYRRSLGSISREQAEAVLHIKQTELMTGVRLTPQEEDLSPDPLFSQFAPEYLAWHESEYPDSHERVRGICADQLIPVFGTFTLSDITPRLVEHWKARRMKQMARATVAKELRTLKAVLNKAIEWGAIDKHNIKSVKAPKNLDDAPPPFYTRGQLQAIYQAAIKHGAVWKFMANTGLRRMEMLNARRSDVVGDSLRVISTTQSRTKAGKWRLVPLSPGAIDALAELGEDHLAPRMYPTSLSRAFRLDAKAAKQEGSIHWLRHTFCSHLVMNGVDLRTVQELAGHADFKTTLNYAHLSAGHLDAAVKGLVI